MQLDVAKLGSMPWKRLPLWVVAIFATIFLSYKLTLIFFAQPQIDETYYWLWGQLPQLTYIDHPPLHGWVQGLVSIGLGWSVFALRALSLVTTGVTLWLVWVWSRRLTASEEDARYAFLLTVALLYSTPLMLFYSTLAVHERLLLVLLLLSTHFFADFAMRWTSDSRTSVWRLYLAAGFLGLATLTKYMGGVVGIGFALVLLLRRDTRRLYLNPHLWLAALLSVLMQAPLLLWNLQHGFESLAFHVTEKSTLNLTGIKWAELRNTLLEGIALTSPFWLWGLGVFLFRRAGAGFGGLLHSFSRGAFVATTLAVFILATTLSRDVLPYWNVPAYAAFFAMAAWFMRSRVLLLAHFATGTVLSGLLVYHFSFFPVLDERTSLDSGNLYGWDQVSAEVLRAQAETGAEFLASNRWEEASQLGFALRRTDIAALTEDVDAFDQWFEPASRDGQDAIVLVRGDALGDLAYVSTLFERVEPYRELTVTVADKPVFTHRLYLAQDFRAERSIGLED